MKMRVEDFFKKAKDPEQIEVLRQEAISRLKIFSKNLTSENSFANSMIQNSQKEKLIKINEEKKDVLGDAFKYVSKQIEKGFVRKMVHENIFLWQPV